MAMALPAHEPNQPESRSPTPLKKDDGGKLHGRIHLSPALLPEAWGLSEQSPAIMAGALRSIRISLLICLLLRLRQQAFGEMPWTIYYVLRKDFHGNGSTFLIPPAVAAMPVKASGIGPGSMPVKASGHFSAAERSSCREIRLIRPGLSGRLAECWSRLKRPQLAGWVLGWPPARAAC